MKTTLTLLAVLLSAGLFGQATIPNQDFEGWISSTHPKNWKTTTQMLPPGYVTCQRTTNSHSGTYAIELTTIDMEGWAVPGVITLGELGIGYTSGGIAFADKPETLKGFLRHPSQGDMVMVIVQFYSAGNEIGTGFWSTTDSIPDYQEFNVPITFMSTVTPDTMNITILTDQNQAGSKLFVDGLHFEYATTEVGEMEGGQGLRVYPNPCGDQIWFSTDPGSPFEAFFYDLQGREVSATGALTGESVDTSHLPGGSYVMLVRSPLGIFREKILKQ